jgi:hypothetical protein
VKTIRVDIPDEDYAELKFSTHFGEISFILRRAVHDFLVKNRIARGGTKDELANGDKGTQVSQGRGAEKAEVNSSGGKSRS